MDLLAAILLGVVQGLTEFLPVSSDGHLALTYALLGAKPNLTFEVFLHAGTLLATILYFRHDLWRMVEALWKRGPEFAAYRRLDMLVAIGTVATLPVALLLEPLVEPLSSQLLWVGVFFLFTAAVLATCEKLAEGDDLGRPAQHLVWWKAIPVGIAQGLAVLPAVSRSGNTIAIGMVTGLSREEAARFSFLLGVPIIAVANVKSGFDILTDAATRVAFPGLVPTLVGTLASLIVGYAAVAFLLGFVRRHSLYPFAIYTAVLGSAILLWKLFF